MKELNAVLFELLQGMVRVSDNVVCLHNVSAQMYDGVTETQRLFLRSRLLIIEENVAVKVMVIDGETLGLATDDLEGNERREVSQPSRLGRI